MLIIQISLDHFVQQQKAKKHNTNDKKAAIIGSLRVIPYFS